MDNVKKGRGIAVCTMQAHPRKGFCLNSLNFCISSVMLSVYEYEGKLFLISAGKFIVKIRLFFSADGQTVLSFCKVLFYWFGFQLHLRYLSLNLYLHCSILPQNTSVGTSCFLQRCGRNLAVHGESEPPPFCLFWSLRLCIPANPACIACLPTWLCWICSSLWAEPALHHIMVVARSVEHRGCRRY